MTLEQAARNLHRVMHTVYPKALVEQQLNLWGRSDRSCMIRRLQCLILRYHYGFGPVEIGRLYGVNHTTVIYYSSKGLGDDPVTLTRYCVICDALNLKPLKWVIGAGVPAPAPVVQTPVPTKERPTYIKPKNHTPEERAIKREVRRIRFDALVSIPHLSY